MKKFLLEIEYFGKNFKGWQIQKNQRTVQDEIQKALKKLLEKDIEVVGSGRTDSGVHAYHQKAHFEAETSIPAENFVDALNNLLDYDVKIKSCIDVDNNFHARYDVTKKTYLYKLFVSDIPSPLKSDFTLFVPYDINVRAMKKACSYIKGTHDFTSFCSADCEIENKVRTIYKIKIKKYGFDELHIFITGNGFLTNMVRIIVGTLIDVGRGKIKASKVKEIINSKDRTKAGKTVAPQGLYLYDVEYKHKVRLI